MPLFIGGDNSNSSQFPSDFSRPGPSGNPTDGVRQTDGGSQTGFVTGSPYSVRGPNTTAQHRLGQWLDSQRRNAQNAPVTARAISSLNGAERRDAEEYKKAVEELISRSNQLSRYVDICKTFCTTVPGETISAKGGRRVLKFIEQEAMRIKKCLERMITLNQALRYDQIIREFGDIRPYIIPNTFQPAAVAIPSTPDEAMQMKPKVEERLMEMRERVNGFLTSSTPPEANVSLFDSEEELKEIESKEIKSNRAALQKMVAIFSNSLLENNAAGSRSADEASSPKTFDVKNLLSGLRGLLSREKSSAANAATAAPNIDAILQQFSDRKTAREADDDGDGDEFWG